MEGALLEEPDRRVGGRTEGRAVIGRGCTTFPAAGDVETRIGRFAINPSDSHVSRARGPHLNLEVQINGRPVGRDPHLRIDPSPIRPGDHPQR